LGHATIVVTVLKNSKNNNKEKVMVKAILTKGISIETPDTVGTAAKVTELVSNQAKTNIRAAWAAGENGHGYFSLITDSNGKALEVLKKDFPKTQELDLLVFGATNKLGEIYEITNQLSKANININYLYTTLLDNKPALVLSTNDNKKALGLFAN
jgi:hypothetical protein